MYVILIFFTTFAELIEMELPENAAEDSFSNLPLWKQTGKYDRISTIYSNGFGSFGVAAGKWKLACCEDSGMTPKAAKSVFTKEWIEQKNSMTWNRIYGKRRM